MDEQNRKILRDIVFFCFENNIPIGKTGSRVYDQNNLTESSDYDYIIYLSNERDERFFRLMNYHDFLSPHGEPEEDYGLSGTLKSYRSNKINLLLVNTEEEFRRWMFATEAMKRLYHRSKFDRCRTFEMLYENKIG